MGILSLNQKNMKRTNILNICFSIVFALEIFALITENTALRFITKPLVVISLIACMAFLNQFYGKFRKRILAGLIFALFGDVFLLFDSKEPLYFMLGLTSFLVCHIFYIMAFNLDMKSAPALKNKYFLPVSIVLAIFCGGFFLYLRPSLGDLQVPVLFYCFVLTLMVMLSFGRWGKVESYGARFITLGALLFLLSDSLLAYNKFVTPIPNGGVAVMATYMLAQYLIVLGTVNRILVSRNSVTDVAT